MMLLHGEQFLQLHRPLLPEDTFTTSSKVVEVANKGSGVIVKQRAESLDSKGNLAITNEITCFVRAAKAKKEIRSVTNNVLSDTNTNTVGDPTCVVDDKTADNQAALYRLSGDLNPLHM